MKNIVVIVVDQLSFRALRAYGGPRAFPAIDSLFERGTNFDRAYTPCPLCMPARAAFWSSSWPHRNGVLSNGRRFEQGEVPASFPALGEIFSRAGWETVHFGKEHDAGALRGFTRVPAGQTPVEPEPGYPVNADTFRDVATREQFVQFLDRRSASAGEDRPRAGRASAESERPLLAVVDLNNPHNICGWVGEMARHVSGDAPFVKADPEPTAGFPPERPPTGLPALPPNFTDRDLATRPRSVRYVCCAHNRQAQTQEWDERHFRLYLDAYYHYTGLVDRQIGRIIDAVHRTLGVDDTLIVFFSDHGDSMIAHRGVTKHTTLYEETTRVPLLFAGPGITPGARIQGPVSLLDLLPTLVDLAGIPNDGIATDGVSLAAALASGGAVTAGGATPERSSGGQPPRCVASEWHTEWGFTIEPGRMITEGRFKYMRYAEGGDEELYDLETDPYETRNLAPASPPELGTMRAALDDHMRATDDPFPRLEAVVDPRWRRHEPGVANHRGIAAPQSS
ncbi:MAG: sulfatase [Spirochaetota bacterium]